MGLHNNVYIGHVETINTEALETENCVESKVVALKLVAFDLNKQVPTYKPLKKYGEYYKIVSVEPLIGLVSDTTINKALKNTGKKEVKVLKKVQQL